MSKLNRLAIKSIPIVIGFIVLVCVVYSLSNQVVLTQRAIYQHIIKVEIKYPYSNDTKVYTIKHHPKTVEAITNDINSQSYGKWRENIGGKESINAVSVKLYSHTETMVASFSLYSNGILERGHNYRQLNAQGFHRQIDIMQLPALRQVWCDSKNINDYSLSQYGQYCADH
ncbi:hypothetical protein ACT3TI_00365 [Psychrobacter sp. AOP22-C1-22]|uniref:hypothetical protein n=1 Tax=unclassified Psychrobacter TaxID=196806 RepID=UPI00178867A6|nr:MULTISPECIES: hypothetical protein [unclassified Psychrobacter]MBE0405354.1 hypothetical protein [Psychrobacter sp. FME6]MBE0445941.1 hypothetical protein [Psychrobacter sp. FME5]MDN5801840.1 hypothetical protein [Psychrobacter sp.]